MIIIRETFLAKPGMASKLAKKMKDAMSGYSGGKVRIMTDLTGRFNTVVMETELKGLPDIEKRMKNYMDNAALRKKMAGYTEMYLTGKREIYQLHS